MLGVEKAFDVENALLIHAEDCVHIPAWAIYDEKQLAPFLPRIKHCHIYMVGLVPKIYLVRMDQMGRTLNIYFIVKGDEYVVPYELQKGLELQKEEDFWFLRDAKGDRFAPSETDMFQRLSEISGAVNFDILYIGQAFGKDGSRSSLDRLKKHETLQKIALQGIPEGYALQLMLIKINSGNRVATMFSPNAKDTASGEDRIRAGIDKLHDTDEAELTTLYEASLIRYFEPKFNKTFKQSFPSTNLKILNDCYDKDFSAIIAEIYFDEMPFMLKSEKQEPRRTIIASHNLHSQEDRNVFFCRE